MAFSEVELAGIEQIVGDLCRRHTREDLKHKLFFEYRVCGHDVAVFECRPFWNDPTEMTSGGVAKFKFVRSRNEWQLYWQRADLKWHRYDPYPASKEITQLVEEVEADRYGCFFG